MSRAEKAAELYRKGLTYEQIAEEMAWSRATIFKLLRGCVTFNRTHRMKDGCRVCGEKNRRHAGYGLCNVCYHRHRHSGTLEQYREAA